MGKRASDREQTLRKRATAAAILMAVIASGCGYHDTGDSAVRVRPRTLAQPLNLVQASITASETKCVILEGTSTCAVDLSWSSDYVAAKHEIMVSEDGGPSTHVDCVGATGSLQYAGIAEGTGYRFTLHPSSSSSCDPQGRGVEAATTRFVNAHRAFITASPNPCSADTGESPYTCDVTIHYASGHNVSHHQVWVSTNGSAENLFSSKAQDSNTLIAEREQIAGFIHHASEHVFTLYEAPGNVKGNVVTDAGGNPVQVTVRANKDIVTREGNGLELNANPYRGIGFVKNDLFHQFLGTTPPSEDMARQAIDDAAALGGAFIRFDATAFWPSNQELWETSPAEYWGAFDRMVAHADARGVKLIPVIWWNKFLFADMVGEPLGEAFDLSGGYSAAHQKLRSFVADLVPRYADDPTILAWELSYALTAFADVDFANRPDATVNTNSGTPPARTAQDNYTSDQVAMVIRDLAELVRSLDPRHMISGGHSTPLVNQMHQRATPEWDGGDPTPDTFAEMRAYTSLMHPENVDLVTVGLFNGGTNGDHLRFGYTGKYNPDVIEAYVNASEAISRPLFVNQFTDADPWLREDENGNREDGPGNFTRRVLLELVDHRIPLSSAWQLERYERNPTTLELQPAAASLDPYMSPKLDALLHHHQAAHRWLREAPSTPSVALPVPNPEFDEDANGNGDPDGWETLSGSATGDVVRFGGDPFQGAISMRLKNLAGNGGATFIVASDGISVNADEPTAADGGEDVVLSAAIRHSPVPVGMHLVQYDSGGTQVARSALHSEPRAWEYRVERLRVTLQAVTRSVRIEFHLSGEDANNRYMDVDDVRLSRLRSDCAPGTACSDGDSSNGDEVCTASSECIAQPSGPTTGAANLVVDAANPAPSGSINRIWSGGNSSLLRNGFDPVLGKVGTDSTSVYAPDWVKRNFPYVEYVRVGNTITGHCDPTQNPAWEELLDSDIFQPTRLLAMLQEMRNAGTRPLFTFTGTPREIAENTGCASVSYGVLPAPPGDPAGDPTVTADRMNRWQDLVGEIAQAAIDEFGASEVAQWKWATWTVPGEATHFSPSEPGQPGEPMPDVNNNRRDIMADLIERTAAGFEPLIQGGSQLDVRIGNFFMPCDPQSYLLADANGNDGILDRLSVRNNVDVANQLNGIGIALYEKPARTLYNFKGGINELKSIMSNHGLNLPIHVDELGLHSYFLPYSTYFPGCSGFNMVRAWHHGPGVHGASWTARVLHLMLEQEVASVSPWHLETYLKQASGTPSIRDEEYWLKLARLNVYDMYESLVGLPELTVSGGFADPAEPAPEDMCSGANPPLQQQWVDAVSVAAPTGEIRTVVYHHDKNPVTPLAAEMDVELRFQGLASGTYNVNVYRIDETRGSVWEHIIVTDPTEHYITKYYDCDLGKYKFDSKYPDSTNPQPVIPPPDQLKDPDGSAPDETVRDLQKLDEYYLADSWWAYVDQATYSMQLDMPAFGVALVLLTPVTSCSAGDSTLSFERTLLSSSGVAPDIAQGISFERGVDPGGPVGSPGSIWAQPGPNGEPPSTGSEELRGVRTGPGSQLTYRCHGFDPTGGSLDVWVQPSWSTPGTPGNDHTIVAWQPNPGQDEFLLRVVDENTVEASFTIDGSTVAASTSITWPWALPGPWHQIHVDWSASGVNLEVDGIPADPSGAISVGNLAGTMGRLQIGQVNGQDAWDGVIDELTITSTP